MKFRSIAVEGPIGVGKTSFVERLARRFDAHVVLEDLNNPFLKSFYQDSPGAAFQVQLFFLLSRNRQLHELSHRDLFQQVTICDYIFPKDKIFAYLNLDDSELLIYDKLYAMLEEQVPKPDMVIFLQAETQTLIDRIRRMSRVRISSSAPIFVQNQGKSAGNKENHASICRNPAPSGGTVPSRRPGQGPHAPTTPINRRS